MLRIVLVPVVLAGLALAICPDAGAQEPSPLTITSAPVISGEARVDATLSSTRGEWTTGDGTTPVLAAYRWFSCPPEVAPSIVACSAVTGVQLDAPAPYTITAADEERRLAILLTVTQGNGSASAFSAPTTAVLRPPSNSEPPDVDGNAREGRTLTASPGEWRGTGPLTFTYSWERCRPSGQDCQAIATGRTYAVASADVGQRLRVGVIAENAGGPSSPAYSALTGVVGPSQLISLEPPAITGAAEVGRDLRTTSGGWNDDGPIDFEYRWLRCDANGRGCAPIAGATRATYQVQALDAGFRLRARVTATSDSGLAASESAMTGVVTGPDGSSPSPLAGALPMQPFPRVRIRGYSTSRGAVLNLVLIRGARGATIGITCRRAGCPFRHRERRAGSRRVRLRVLERAFPAGTRIVFRITTPLRIGKYTKIVIRSERPPTRRDRCLMPDSPRPVDCPTF